MDILFVVNPVAGKGKTKEIIPLIEDICKKNDVEYEMVFTSMPNDAINLSKDGINRGFSRIIAVGGDGTLNEVINGVAETDASFGIIPGGSGNDFIRSLAEKRELEQIIYDNIFGNIKPIDIARCNDRYFINVASIGFDSDVVLATKETKKIFSGSTAYIAAVLKTILTYKGKRIKVDIDGNSFEENTLLVAVANGKYYGGGIKPAPDAEIDDGILDICFIRNVPKPKIIALFPKFIKGNHEDIKEVSMYRGKKIRLTCPDYMPTNVDGEIFLNTEVEFEIIPKGINVIIPR